jgi:hypothetical protein
MTYPYVYYVYFHSILLKSKYYICVAVLVFIMSRIVCCVPKHIVYFHTFDYFSKSSKVKVSCDRPR